jgi:hypothetical protein
MHVRITLICIRSQITESIISRAFCWLELFDACGVAFLTCNSSYLAGGEKIAQALDNVYRVRISQNLLARSIDQY